MQTSRGHPARNQRLTLALRCDCAKSDQDRDPRLRLALEHNQVTELGPGDVWFIRQARWHHVESLAAFNMLVNYRWNPTQSPASPGESLLHAIIAHRHWPMVQRAVCRTPDDCHVFQTSADPLGHLPPELRGLMGERGQQALGTVRTILMRSLCGG